MTTNNAGIRLELFDGTQWHPMELPRDEDYGAVSDLGRMYVEHGAAKSVRVQLQRDGEWVTVKTIERQIVSTLGPVTTFCICGHAEAAHDTACRITLSSRVCPCERFELRAI